MTTPFNPDRPEDAAEGILESERYAAANSRNIARRGPFEVEVTSGAIPVSCDPRADAFPAWTQSPTVEKLVSRFTLAVGGDVIATQVPYFHGSTDGSHAQASAVHVLASVLDDLAGIAPYVPEGDEREDGRAWEDAAMIEWLDDLGTFATADGYGRQSIDTRRQILDGFRAWRSVRAWWELAVERAGEEEVRAVLAARDWDE